LPPPTETRRPAAPPPQWGNGDRDGVGLRVFREPGRPPAAGRWREGRLAEELPEAADAVQRAVASASRAAQAADLAAEGTRRPPAAVWARECRAFVPAAAVAALALLDGAVGGGAWRGWALRAPAGSFAHGALAEAQALLGLGLLAFQLLLSNTYIAKVSVDDGDVAGWVAVCR